MKQFYLTEIVTKDKLIHQGIFFRPKKAGKKAILWVHGLTSTFYGGIAMLEAFAQGCQEERIGFASFNNRGHDMITGIRKLDKRKKKGYSSVLGGAAMEKFKGCVYDIDAGVSFLVRQGYSEIILAGHSTGANKVCYYAGNRRDPRVAAVVLAGPLSDRLGQGPRELKTKRDAMMELVREGKGDEPVFGYDFFPMTPRRFLSIYASNTSEDTFDYGDSKPKLIAFSRIRQPMLVLVGESDEHLDRPAKQLLDVFAHHTRSHQYQSIIIPAALHSFNGKEQEVVSSILRWVREI